MAYPVDDPDWASDTNFSTGSESGSPTKVDPGASYEAQGFVPGDAFVGPYVNFLLNRLCAWVVLYLKDLHNQAEFLGKAYTWLGTHIFGSGSGAWTVVSGSITSPGGNIDTGGQIEAQSFVIDSASAEVSYKAGRTRIKRYSWSGYGSSGRQGAFVGLDSTNSLRIFVPTGSADTGAWREPIRLPVGATITGWRVLCTPDGTSADLQCRLFSRTDDFTTPAEGSPAGQGTLQTSSGGGIQVLVDSGLGVTVVAGTHYYLDISGTAAPGGSDISHILHSYELTFTDVGPRAV